MESSQVTAFIEALSLYQHDPIDTEPFIDLLFEFRTKLRNDSTLKGICGSTPEFWTTLANVWQTHAEVLSTSDSSVIRPITSLGYFLGVLCLDEAHNQEEAFSHLDRHLTRILHYASSLANLENPAYTLMTRVICQTYSNISHNNSIVTQSCLSRRIESEPIDHLICRLLASSDSMTLQAVLHLVETLVSTDTGARQFASSQAGVSILDRILMLVEITFDPNDVDAEADDIESSIFSPANSLVNELIDRGAFPPAYRGQSSSDTNFVVSSPQVILLKFLDGYLQLPQHSDSRPTPSIVDFILREFTHLSTAMLRQDRPKDGRDAATFQGLVLLLQCIITIGLGTKEGRSIDLNPIIEEIVVLLAQCDALITIPKIIETEASGIEPVALAQLKRLLVQTLGILCSDSKDAQDRTRESGGLALLLGMCQINDANPTLREHALFSIRNILKDNVQNQEVISKATTYRVGETGEFYDLPPAMRT